MTPEEVTLRSAAADEFPVVCQSLLRRGREVARDKELSDEPIPNLVRCPRDGPHPRRGHARRDQRLARGGPNGTVTEGPYPEAIGGFWVADVSSREEALEWAVKTAVACRCAQEVREFMPDAAVGN